jgi:hypothetical protein
MNENYFAHVFDAAFIMSDSPFIRIPGRSNWPPMGAVSAVPSLESKRRDGRVPGL